MFDLRNFVIKLLKQFIRQITLQEKIRMNELLNLLIILPILSYAAFRCKQIWAEAK